MCVISPLLTGATELRDLTLHVNFVADLSPLAGLSRLESLNLSSNQLSDLTPLADLTKLRALSVGANELSLEDIVAVALLPGTGGVGRAVPQY